MTKVVGSLACSPRQYSRHNRRLATSSPARLSVENPWQGGPPITTSALGTSTTSWIGSSFRTADLKLAAHGGGARLELDREDRLEAAGVDKAARHRPAASKQVNERIALHADARYRARAGGSARCNRSVAASRANHDGAAMF